MFDFTSSCIYLCKTLMPSGQKNVFLTSYHPILHHKKSSGAVRDESNHNESSQKFTVFFGRLTKEQPVYLKCVWCAAPKLKQTAFFTIFDTLLPFAQ